jgi:hypothetical protein
MEHEMETDTLNKVQDAELINDTRKSELLSTPIEHIDITRFDAPRATPRPLLAAPTASLRFGLALWKMESPEDVFSRAKLRCAR